MWALIISLVYNRSCRRIMAGLVTHQHRWM
jgi:hypothetical protein